VDLQKQLTELVVFSSGSFTWTEVWYMSYSDRELAVKILNNYNQLKAGKQPNEYL
jgi:hypothetical protein